jgi:hypothetical protein
VQVLPAVAVVGGQAPVVRALPAARADVAGPGAGVVDPHRRRDRPAEQLRQRQPRPLPEDVPEGEVNSGVAAGLGAGTLVADVRGEPAGHAFRGRVGGCEQDLRRGLVQVGSRSASTVSRTRCATPRPRWRRASSPVVASP